MTKQDVLKAETVIQAVSEAFENMAFLEAVPNTEKKVPGVQNSCYSKIEILSPFSGYVAVVCNESVATDITKAVFGDISHSQAELKKLDTLGEMVNTIAGRLLYHSAGGREPFELGLPNVGHGLTWDTKEVDIYSFTVDQNILLVIIYIAR